MNDRPFISILMTVYNNERYFPNAVQRILSQDFEDWELIVVDDGSTDGTPALADAFARDDPRVHVIHQENRWIFAALNRAMDAARGEYIFVHNSDDTIRQGSLRIMAQKAQQFHPDVVWVPIILHKCDENQNIVEYNFLKLDETLEEKYYATKKEIEENWMQFWKEDLSINQVNLYRAELMKKHRFREDWFGSDTLFNIGLADEIRSAFTLGERVYEYYQYVSVDNMNASIGKWYGYEHEMYHEMYSRSRDLLHKWGRPEEELLYWDNWRLKNFFAELDLLTRDSGKLSADEGRDYLRRFSDDKILLDCAVRMGRTEELQERIQWAARMMEDPNLRKRYEQFITNAREHREDVSPETFRTRNRIYIYGAGEAGQEAFYDLRSLNCVDAFIDRSPVKQREGYCNLPVLSPEVLFDAHDKTHIILIALKEAVSAGVLADRLQMAGYRYGTDVFHYSDFLSEGGPGQEQAPIASFRAYLRENACL